MSSANSSRDAALDDATWQKSSRSGGQNQCVEVTTLALGYISNS